MMDCAENHTMEHTTLLEGKTTVHIVTLCRGRISRTLCTGVKKVP